MGYVIAAILVLLIVGGFVFFLVTNATRKSNVSDAGDPGADQNALGIIGSDDETPAGDTSQLSDEHGEEGKGGEASEVPSRRGRPGHTDPSVARPVVGGEAEGERSTR
jgi:hypothetical protein